MPAKKQSEKLLCVEAIRHSEYYVSQDIVDMLDDLELFQI